MRCPNCASPNAAGARFCAACGTGLTATCPYCSAETLLGQRFCGSCGGLLVEAAGEPERETPPGAAPTAERRLVSVLFVDLEGFTRLAEQLDVEEVRTLQQSYFELASGHIRHYGGVVEKYIGDAVMAVWGAPQAHEDDAVRAVRAGLAIVAGVGRLSAGGQRLRARGAVATGEAAVSLDAAGQGMLSGDLINTAARLQQAARAGTLLVDQATRRAAVDSIDFRPLPAARLKGKARAVPAWRVTAPAGAADGRAVGHPGPFVGRDADFSELVQLFERTAERRRCRLVSVLGIAGIGKSRLAWELHRHLVKLAEPASVLTGRCLSYGEGITFAPLAEMIAARIGRAAPAAGDELENDLRLALGELAAADERDWLLPRLAALVRPAAQPYEREELFAAWRRFFSLGAADAPGVLIFEDVQWADPALLDFIEYLALWSRDQPLLIITLARPELLDQRPNWGAEQAFFASLQLAPLTDEAMAALLRALAPRLDEKALARIVARAGGVPLYGVEVARMLDVAPSADPGDVPETLHSLVAARIDSLPAGARRLLLSAAVLGGRFEARTLAALLVVPPASVREPLELLVRRELLTVAAERGPAGSEQYAFVQEVVREVAYRTLSRRQRRSLHLAAGQLAEGSDDLLEQLAEHLFSAHEAEPSDAEAPGLARRAVDALRRAADRSVALHAPARALASLERALQLNHEPGLESQLLADAAQAARLAGRFELAEDLLNRLVALHAGRAEREQAAHARASLASLLFTTERHSSALSELASALGDIADVESDPAAVELAAQLARGRVLVGEEAEGLEWAERALAGARRLGLTGVAVDALTTRGTARLRLGLDEAGRRDLEQAMAEAAELGLVSAELRARNNLAWLRVLEDPHESLASARSGRELAARMGIGDLWLQLSLVSARVAFDTGEWDYALAVIGEAAEQPQAPAHQVQLAALRTSLLALRGEASEALLQLSGAADPRLDRQILADLDVAGSWLAFCRGEFDDARRLARAAAATFPGGDRLITLTQAGHAAVWAGDEAALARDVAELAGLSIAGRVAAAHQVTLEAALAALRGEPGAEDRFGAAAERWRVLDLPLHLGLCLAERARLLGGSSDEARAAFRSLRAHGLLRLLPA